MARKQLGAAISAAKDAATKAYADSQPGIVGATGPVGATGASGVPGGSGAPGASGASGAPGPQTVRNISTLTSNATLGASGGVDYVVFANISAPAPASVVSMLHFDGANGASDAPSDTATGAGTWTRGGGALSTAHFKFGTASWYGGLFYPNSGTHWSYGTGEFCLEMWIRPSAGITSGSCLFDFRAPSEFNSAKPFVYVNSTGKLVYHVNGSDRITGVTSLSLNAWQHVALCRASGTTRLFLNGKVEGSWADSTDYGTTVNTRPIFLRNAADTGGGWNTVYVDEVRNTKGAAPYVAAFTPYVAAFTTTGGIPPQVAMPGASGNFNHYTIKNINADALALAGLIDGASGSTVPSGGVVRLVPDGSGFRTV